MEPLTDERLDEIERTCGYSTSICDDVRALVAEVRRLRAENEELRKSQGYAAKPHWESHWDRGSQEEV